MNNDILNTDIYNIMNSILQLQKQYTDEDEATLSVSIYGYFGSIEAKKIQRAIQVASQLANEAFPTRAKLEKNIIIHSIMNNITDINAIPAKIYALLAIHKSDVDKYMKDNKLIIDSNNTFSIGKYEYHLDYDIILSQVVLPSNKTMYSARYDISQKNPCSDIRNIYLAAPSIINLNEMGECIALKVQLLQYHKETINKKLVTNNTIDNKTITFTVQDQLAFFTIKVTENNASYYITPIFEGSALDVEADTVFCYYLYLDSSTVRIKFVEESIQPGLNAEIEISVYSTKGSNGNFEYTDNIISSISSDEYGYKNIDTYMILESNSFNGADRKSKEELKKILPKEILAKKCITTTKMLNNYFNTLNTELVNIYITPKIDNQLERVYYGYLKLKDTDNNVIPTNTLNILVQLDQITTSDFNRSIIPAGTLFGLNYKGDIAKIINISEINDYDFVYTTMYTLVITENPLYLSSYMMITNEIKYLYYNFVNDKSDVQFISNSIQWTRKLLSDNNIYSLEITISQSIMTDLGLLTISLDENNKVVVSHKMKILAVFYKDDAPYRYLEGELIDYNISTFDYTWRFTLLTNDSLDDKNNIKILNLKACQDNNNSDIYGYLEYNSDVKIYVLAKLEEEYGRHDLDSICPGYSGWSVCNIFQVVDGINFLMNYTEITVSKVIPATIGETNGYLLKSIPCIGYNYLTSESKVDYITHTLNYEKIYIDSALLILENSISMDFKYYNSYGPGKVFKISDNISILDRVNISLKFRTQLSTSSDTYVIDLIKKDIKDIIEDLNGEEELHIPNIITTITNKYRDGLEAIIFFEFVSINDYGPGMQHLYNINKIPISKVPEFICIGSKLDTTLNIIVPDIDIEIIK